MDQSRAAKAAKLSPELPVSSMSSMSNVAQRHVLRFVPAHTLANVECVTPRMGRVARDAVVELADSRFGITVEPGPGCAWRLLVQEGLAGAGCAGVAVGFKHAILVDPDGRVRSWGGGERGKLGHGSEANVAVPQLIASLESERVVCLSVGSLHSVIVTEAGILYSFGWNYYGQLGLGHKDNVNTPRRVAIQAVRSACAGDYHTAAVTREGSLFSWGHNDLGQLGHGDTTQRSIPAAVASVAHLTVKQVTVGDVCTLVVDPEGYVWITGQRREYGGGPTAETVSQIQFHDNQGAQPLRSEQV
mgnify:CR=1 FL=1